MQFFTFLLLLSSSEEHTGTKLPNKALLQREDAVGMLRDNYIDGPVGQRSRLYFRQGLISWCNKKSRFSMSTFDPILQGEKVHQIRTEKTMHTIPLQHPNSIICAVRSTKAYVPKGDRYAFKLSLDPLDDEVIAMRKLGEQGLTKAIRCKWNCALGILAIQVTRVTMTWGRPTRTERVNVDFNLFPMEYFDAPTLSDFLISFSASIPITETETRAGLLHTPAVFQAYQTAKKAVLDFLSASWTHRELTVLNILYSRQKDDIRIINLEDARNFDDVRSSGDQVSPLAWMTYVADDFRAFSASFALTIFCPEEFRNEYTEDCIADEEIGRRMGEFDEDFRIIGAFLLNDASERRLDQLPERFQSISRNLGRDFVPGTASAASEEQAPPPYHSADIYPDTVRGNSGLGAGGLFRESIYDSSNQAGPSNLALQDHSSEGGPSLDNGEVSPLRAHMLEMHLESVSSHSSSSNGSPEEHVAASHPRNIPWQRGALIFSLVIICFLVFEYYTCKEEWEMESFYEEADF